MRLILTAALALVSSTSAAAQTAGFQDELLERMIGDWVLEGDIAGQQVTHDVSFEWVLDHHYVRFHEVSRELEPDGRRAYEAIVIIGSGGDTARYACLWLDTTGVEGLSSGVIGYGDRDDDAIPFVFTSSDGGAIHNTFTYDRDADTWSWVIDNVSSGERSRFASVTLTRK